MWPRLDCTAGPDIQLGGFHIQQPLPLTISSSRPQNICKFWKEGHCSYGASCRFSHAGPSGGRKKGKKGTDVDMVS